MISKSIVRLLNFIFFKDKPKDSTKGKNNKSKGLK